MNDNVGNAPPLTPQSWPTIMIRLDFASSTSPYSGPVLMLKKSELKEYKKILLGLRVRLRGDVEQLTDEALDRSEDGSDSKSPTHIAELGTGNYEQEFSLRVAESDQELLEEIDAALKRIYAGTFGACEGCLAGGKAPSKVMILKTRLKAIPYARNCVECERNREELTL